MRNEKRHMLFWNEYPGAWQIVIARTMDHAFGVAAQPLVGARVSAQVKE
jgi:hypothetical protein